MIHSGLWRERGPWRTLGNLTMRPIPIYLMRTIGDRTPTYAQTLEASRYFMARGYRCGPPSDFEPTETNWLLRRLRHEFRNGIPMLLRLAGIEGPQAITQPRPMSMIKAARIFTNRIIGANRRAG